MIAIVSVVTYLLRSVFLVGIEYVETVPTTVERLLEFFPIAVLSALIAPNLLVIEGSLSIANPRLAAGLVAFGVAWYTDNLFATVGVGMAVFWALLFFA
jgi:branched-subunit amino acid transport protein